MVKDDQQRAASIVGLDLVELLQRNSEEAREFASHALRNLDDKDMAKVVEAGDIPKLVELLRSGSADTKAVAAGVLMILARNDDNRARIAQAGAIPHLVELLRCNSAKGPGRAAAAHALRNLAARNDENRAKIIEAGAIPELVEILRRTGEEVKAVAAHVLRNLARNDLHRARIVEAGAIPALLDLLRHSQVDAKVAAAYALTNLACHDVNMSKIAEAGAIPELVELLRSSTDEAKAAAAHALWNLACKDANMAKIAQAGAIPELVALVQGGPDIALSAAAGALQNLACLDANKVIIAEAGAIPCLVELLQRGPDDTRAAVTGALQNLALHDENKVKFVEVDVIRRLLDMIAIGDVRSQADASSILLEVASFPHTLGLLILNGAASVIRAHQTVIGLVADPSDPHLDVVNSLVRRFNAVIEDGDRFAFLLSAASLLEQQGIASLTPARLHLAVAVIELPWVEAASVTSELLHRLRQTGAIPELLRLLCSSAPFSHRLQAAETLIVLLKRTAWPELPELPRAGLSLGAPAAYREMFDNPRFADVKLRCDDGREFYGHKVLLCSLSEYFSCLLAGEMQEAARPVVTLHLPSREVEAVLRFLYSSGEEGVSERNALDLLGVADMLQLPQLAQRCEEIAAECVTLDSAPRVLELALRANAKVLPRYCVAFAMRSLPDKQALQLLEGVPTHLLPKLPWEHPLYPQWPACTHWE